jgi:predicted Holliday junction resolvase-like endonuclease
MRDLVEGLGELGSLVCICPHCGEMFRLAEARLFYGRAPSRTWFDDLMKRMEGLEDARRRFEERRREMQEESRRAVERRVRRELRRRDPLLTPRGYYPKDARALLDPVDFVVFDGMHLSGRVRKVVLLDHEAEDASRERVQRSVERAVERGNVDWALLRVDEDGRVRFEEAEGR